MTVLSLQVMVGLVVVGFILGWATSIFVAWLIAKNRETRD